MVNSYLYSEPERYGLAVVGEVDWSDGYYQFDLTVVWRDAATGEVFYGQDEGCSCPTPFEKTNREDLHKINRAQDLIDHIERHYAQKMAEDYRDDDHLREAKAKAGELVMKTRVALDSAALAGREAQR